MSDRMRLMGMYSGMDTESIISQLVAVKQNKVTKLKGEQTKLEWKQTQWQDLNSKIYSLYSSTLSNLRYESSYSKKSTTCSDTTKASVVAGNDAVVGTQTLQVLDLAKSGYITGAELKQKESADGKKSDWKTSDKLSDMANGSLVGKTISITVGKGDDAKTTDIKITGDMTIAKFTEELKNAGVNASFDEGNQRFFISSTSTGTANGFEITAKDADGNESLASLTALGIGGTADCAKVKAQDAKIVLNNATFTSDTNTFSINGLTITALGETDGEITINTTNDYEGVYNTIKDFISEYNELIIEMDKLYNADSARKYDMLTDEEKEAMTDEEIEKWEDTIKNSLLRKDSTISTIMNSMTNIMMDGYEINGEKKYLFDFGIKTLSYFEAEDHERRAYHIDGDPDNEKTSGKTDMLKKAIAEDPQGTAEFFSTLCKKMYEKLDKLMASTEYSSVYKVYNDKQLKSEYDEFDKKIKDAEEALADYEDKWYDKFSAMESAMAKMQSNSNAVTSMLGM